jgi:hypothetical protein
MILLCLSASPASSDVAMTNRRSPGGDVKECEAHLSGLGCREDALAAIEEAVPSG